LVQAFVRPIILPIAGIVWFNGAMINNQTAVFLGDKADWVRARLELADVQALWGGRRITVSGDGTAVIEIVTRDDRSQQHTLTLSQTQVHHLFQLCIDNDFVTIQIEERMGIPDETRPCLTLVNTRKDSCAICKWARMQNGRFDAIYTVLLALEQEAATHT
jgi:hypothetical protein